MSMHLVRKSSSSYSAKDGQRSSRSSSAKDDDWCLKCINKVVCEWNVNITERKIIRSPTFWHPGSSEWGMELRKEGQIMLLFFNLLSWQRDSSVKAELTAKCLWGSDVIADSGSNSVTLNKAQLFSMVRFNNSHEQFTIRGEVSVSSETPELYKSAALQRGLLSVTNNLGVLLDSGTLSDIMLCAGDTKFRAHKAVLSACSPVFAAMLRHNTQETRTGTVEVKDVDPDVLSEVLRYIYTGSAPCMEVMADKLLVVADKYGLLELKRSCEEELARCLAVDNAAATAVIALTYSCDLLKRSAIGFIRRNFVRVLGTEGWAGTVRRNAEIVVEISSLIADESVE